MIVSPLPGFLFVPAPHAQVVTRAYTMIIPSGFPRQPQGELLIMERQFDSTN